MNPIAEQKAALRRRLRSELERLPEALRVEGASRLLEHIRRQAVWRQSSVVLLYVPIRGEPDLSPLLDEALQQGKQVLLPRFVSLAEGYEPAEILDPTTDLVSGAHGVLEPVAACPARSIKSLDVALVPGLGFDRAGRRLGRGKGYYDRLLTGASGVFWGAGFDVQLIPEVPGESHDVVLNCIATPSRWIEVVPPRTGE